MSMISKDGLEQIRIIRNALDSIYNKLGATVYTKVRPTKNEDVNYKPTKVFDSVQEEFEAIAGILSDADSWGECNEKT